MSSLPPQSAKGACFVGFWLPMSQLLQLLGQPYLLILELGKYLMH